MNRHARTNPRTNPRTNQRFFRQSLFGIVLVSLFLITSVTVLAQDAKLTGTWKYSDGAATLTLTLNPDGTGSLNDDGFKYTVSGNRLLVVENTVSIAYTFSLNGDALTVSGAGLPRPLTFMRQGGGGVGLFEKGLNKDADKSARAGAEEEGNGLVGLWKSYQGNSVTVQIFKDGKLTINGEPFRYSVDGRFINLTNNEGTARVEFDLDGDTLTTNYQGQSSVYRRVRRGSEPAEEAAGC